jgi:hypothetical protein
MDSLTFTLGLRKINVNLNFLLQAFKIGSFKAIRFEKRTNRDATSCNRDRGFLINKLNFWITNFFLTAVISFLLNGGVFAGNKGGISLSEGNLGAIKLSGKNHTTRVRGKSSVARNQFRKQFDQGIRIRAHQKE